MTLKIVDIWSKIDFTNSVAKYITYLVFQDYYKQLSEKCKFWTRKPKTEYNNVTAKYRK
jgi:hypothetical protein